MRSGALKFVVLAWFAALPLLPRMAKPDDCNYNGIPDGEEISLRPALDCNSNGVPDPCDLFTGRFFGPRFLSVRNRSWPAATGDFDGDGDVDLAFPGEAGSILVLRNRGKLAFDAAAFFLEAEPGPSIWIYDLAAADFDGDGDLDLAAMVDDYKVFILENDGGGNFLTRVRFVKTSAHHSIAAGDLDGDGDKDLVTGGLQVFFNDGGFSFRSSSSYGEGEPEALADLDGDGDLDLAASMRQPDRIELLFNRGDGAFDLPVKIPMEAGPQTIIAGDLDGDGDLDLAVENLYSSDVAILLQEGIGFFSESSRVRFDNSDIRGLAGSDLDRDGDMDLALISSSHGPQLLRNRGDGSFDSPVDMLLENEGWYTSRMDWLVFADLDGDSDQDLISSGTSGEAVLLFPNSGDGRFHEPVELGFGGAPSSAAADLDGDGDLDLVAAHEGTGDLAIFWNGGGGKFLAATILETGGFPGTVLPGDLDGDGDNDLAALTGEDTLPDSSGIWVYINEGKGRFRKPVLNPVRGRFFRAAAGDLDEDGDLDLALLNSGQLDGDSGTVSLVLNRGDGVLVESSKLPAGAFPVAVAMADLDGDGAVDLIVMNQIPCCPANPGLPGSIRIFPNRGGGAFGSPVELPAVGSPVALAAADFSGDGRLDLAVANRLSGVAKDRFRFPEVVSIYQNLGGLTFSQPRNYAAGGDSRSALAAGDFDADGDLDLAAAVKEINLDSMVSILLNAGDGTFSPAGLLPTSEVNLNDLFALDIDGDGRDDLVAAGSSLIVFQNRAHGAASLDADLDGIPDECAKEVAFRRGDVDGDGRLALTDPILIFGHLFRGGEPGCREAADADNDGRIDPTDGIWLLLYLFLDGPPPVSPAPPPAPCGRDSDPPGSAGDLGCLRYSGC